MAQKAKKVKPFPSVNRFRAAKLRKSGKKAEISEQEARRVGNLVASAPCAVGGIDGWYPSEAQAKKLCEDVPAHYDFIRWIIESDPELSEQNPEICHMLINALKDVSIC